MSMECGEYISTSMDLALLSIHHVVDNNHHNNGDVQLLLLASYQPLLTTM